MSDLHVGDDHVVLDGVRYDAWLCLNKRDPQTCHLCDLRPQPTKLCSLVPCRGHEREDRKAVVFIARFEHGAALTIEGRLQGKL